MNTTKSDIDIDIENVQEVVTSDLNGEKIERLLYNAGFDSVHKLGSEGVTILEVQAEGVIILVSETWEADGVWYIDPKSVVLDKVIGDYGIDTIFPAVSTEEELVAAIEEFAGTES